jgi:hypothetical protein
MILALVGVSGCLATLSASCELFASNMVELADHAFPGVSGKHDADLSLCNNLEAQFQDGCSAVVDKLGLTGARDLANDEPSTLCAHLPAGAAPVLLETSEGESSKDQDRDEDNAEDQDQDQEEDKEEEAQDDDDAEDQDSAEAQTAVGTEGEEEEEEHNHDDGEDKAEEAQEDSEENKDDEDDDDNQTDQESSGAQSAFLATDKSQFDKDSDKMREAMKVSPFPPILFFLSVLPTSPQFSFFLFPFSFMFSGRHDDERHEDDAVPPCCGWWPGRV